jgi:hypothetical protein
MTMTELDTTIAGVEATLSALEQAHARQVRALQQELAALTAQKHPIPGGGVLYKGTLLGPSDHYRGTFFGPPDHYRGTLFGPPDHYRGTLFGPPDHYRGTLFGPPDGRR